MYKKIKRAVIGAPRDVSDPKTFHKISLIALLAWVGLGADGLSSSAYGPEEAFKAIGTHTYLAVVLALATVITITVISIAYSRIIEHFPYGGGGYIVASHLLGPNFGVVSGAALLVDYILTVSVSVASCADQFFSILPASALHIKLFTEGVILALLVLMNLRGVKESILILAPIFMLFVITHVILIVGGIGMHLTQMPQLVSHVGHDFHEGYSTLGLVGMFAIFLRAYSRGGGTYTGIEAVSNGLQIMREPKVQTGKRTMLYMSISLAFAASGILICYLLFNVVYQEGKTMNAVLLERFAGNWHLAGVPIGRGFVVLALFSEAALLYVAAQAGFIDGPRVMANMALDGWLPRRFSQLSDRLTMQDGLLLMGSAALATLLYTHGDISTLVTMYSINVFLTFSLSEIGMCRFWVKERNKHANWKSQLPIHVIGLVMCSSILTTVIYEKFLEGAWITLVVTSLLIGMCMLIRRHYQLVHKQIRHLDEILEDLGSYGECEAQPIDPQASTAVLMVSGFSGLGVHQLFQIQRLFPHQFKNCVFVSVGVIDSATMKGVEEVEKTKARTEQALKHYVALARRLGFCADYRLAIGTDATAEAENLCMAVYQEFPQVDFFMGRVLFTVEGWYYRFLHNETAYQLQRRLHLKGLNAFVLPVRLSQSKSPLPKPAARAVEAVGR